MCSTRAHGLSLRAEWSQTLPSVTDGFQEYQTHSTAGYENMAWKDSGDPVMSPDGTLVSGLKALRELPGYVYDAGCAWPRSIMSRQQASRQRAAQEGRRGVRKVQRGFLGRTVRFLCPRAGRREGRRRCRTSLSSTRADRLVPISTASATTCGVRLSKGCGSARCN